MRDIDTSSWATSHEIYVVGHSIAATAVKLYNTMPRHKRKGTIGTFVRDYARDDKYGKTILRRAISIEGKEAFEQGVEDALRAHFEPNAYKPKH